LVYGKIGTISLNSETMHLCSTRCFEFSSFSGKERTQFYYKTFTIPNRNLQQQVSHPHPSLLFKRGQSTHSRGKVGKSEEERFHKQHLSQGTWTKCKKIEIIAGFAPG
jgi:hypothetical protein